MLEKLKIKMNKSVGKCIDKAFKVGRDIGFAEGLAKTMNGLPSHEAAAKDDKKVTVRVPTEILEARKRLTAVDLTTTSPKRPKVSRLPHYTPEEDAQIVESGVKIRLHAKMEKLPITELARRVKDDLSSPRPLNSLYKRLTRDLGERIEAVYAEHSYPQNTEDIVNLFV